MAGMQEKMSSIALVRWGTTLQLLLCHCFIFAAIVSELVVTATLNSTHVLFMLGACTLSFIFTLSIPYNLFVLDSALQRLARGFAFESLSLRWRWPLLHLFVLVNMLAEQTGQQVQIEKRNVTYRDQLLEQVRKTAAQEELNRLARDLHDSIKQQIFSIVVSVAAVKARWEHNPSSALKVVDDIERTAQEAQVEMQALLQQLRPVALENVGLIESLRMQCQALGYRTGAEISAELGHLPPDELLPLGAQESIFRIVQEGFANIARYARPAHVWLSLQQQRDALLIEIGDDGQGFDVEKVYERSSTYGGMGLANVRERVHSLGGTLTIWSLPGQGTTLHLSIPLARLQTQEQENQELATGTRKTRRILWVGSWAVALAAVLMLLYTPASIVLWPMGVCLLIALVAWLWAQLDRLQIALDFGRQHIQYIALLSWSYGLLSCGLLVFMLYFSYFDIVCATFSSTEWLALGFYALFVGAIIVSSVFYFQNTHLAYKMFSRKILRQQIRQQFQQMVIDWLVWVTTMFVVIFLLNFPVDDFVKTIRVVILSMWLLFILAKLCYSVFWQHKISIYAGNDQEESRV